MPVQTPTALLAVTRQTGKDQIFIAILATLRLWDDMVARSHNVCLSVTLLALQTLSAVVARPIDRIANAMQLSVPLHTVTD